MADGVGWRCHYMPGEWLKSCCDCQARGEVERIQFAEFHCLNWSDYDRTLEMEVNSYSTAYLDEDGLTIQPAFDRYFECLTLNYRAIRVVNLLMATKSEVVNLSKRFGYHIQNLPFNNDSGRSPEKI
ncbi:hypothetical protein BDZ91DRAFT_717106 [Kalaharituber pfeilii]|nr:hypothetical protein BDZ91DRAFT_717106 [Kalaharituber pfeilii]